MEGLKVQIIVMKNLPGSELFIIRLMVEFKASSQRYYTKYELLSVLFTQFDVPKQPPNHDGVGSSRSRM